MGNCKECNKEIKKYNKFCSNSCAATFNNKARGKKPRRKCRTCDNKVKERWNEFCLECIEKKTYNSIYILSEARTDKTRRTILIRKYGHICSVCNYSVWNEKPIPLELDHINGDATDNSWENLRLICPNCHAQTDNYKGKNKGKSKRKYYIMYRHNTDTANIKQD